MLPMTEASFQTKAFVAVVWRENAKPSSKILLKILLNTLCTVNDRITITNTCRRASWANATVRIGLHAREREHFTRDHSSRVTGKVAWTPSPCPNDLD
ncbi:hypothetical protein [Rhizobium sp. MHM7A]|uniref:hypothetical protein n=1 Tax=Rhizobium sp. MHM7A TaxID=2583233 RepID=UPI0011074796|nr:hypothetical protein [Rhizobium sp. MHM7A]TLX17013.1 hypothetical protein FFR93_06775 [Rhizobium sp. MHM7A]